MVKLGNPKHLKATILLLLISTIGLTAFMRIQEAYGTEYATMRIVNPLRGDGKFLFNVTEEINYTGHTFTVEFYIYNVSNMVAWQFAISWNNSIIQYNQTKNPLSWVFPHGHVFQQAEDEGYTVLLIREFVEVETPDGKTTQDPTAPGIGFLKAGATTIPYYPVNVGSQGALLCRINFTIVATPQPGETLTANINLVKRLDPLNPSIDSFVMDLSTTKIEVNAESAIVRIIYGELKIIRDIAITNVAFDKVKFLVGSNVTIGISFKNEGNDQERFNFTIECEKEDGSLKLTLFRYMMLLNPGGESFYTYIWVIPADFPTGRYIVKVSVEPLEGEKDLTDNVYQLTINVEKELLGFEYFAWLISLWLSTPLGILLIIYLASVIGFFSILKVARRIKH